MTPEEIRTRTFGEDGKEEMLREIAAQFAEFNATTRRQMQVIEQAKKEAMRHRPGQDGFPQTSEGMIIEFEKFGGITYGIVCGCGSIHAIEKDEALQLLKEQEEQREAQTKQ